MNRQLRSLWRRLMLAGVLLVLMATLAPVLSAQAALRGCRADPVFILSDGTVLDLSVSIETDVANVKGIDYVVHGPRGTWLVTALSTPTLGFKGKETVRYVADLGPSQYATDTLVITPVQNVGASSYTVFAGVALNLSWTLNLGLSAQYHVIEGLAGEHLIAYLKK
jgi:hypothetical protein